MFVQNSHARVLELEEALAAAIRVCWARCVPLKVVLTIVSRRQEGHALRVSQAQVEAVQQVG